MVPFEHQCAREPAPQDSNLWSNRPKEANRSQGSCIALAVMNGLITPEMDGEEDPMNLTGVKPTTTDESDFG